MRRSWCGMAILLGLVGCGPSAVPTTAERPQRPRLTVEAMKDGQSGRVAASGLFRDEAGVLWVDADAPVVPTGVLEGLDANIEHSAWIARVGEEYQLGLDLTAPEHVRGRAAPRKARWIEAGDLGAIVARIRDGGYPTSAR